MGAGIDKAQAAKPFFAEAGQKTFGFLGASRVIPVAEWNIENQQPGMLCTYDSGALCEAIRQTKQQCDFLTVYVHWGIERENSPQEYQRQLAKAYIDAGADLVVGAHPHVLQGIEYYKLIPAYAADAKNQEMEGEQAAELYQFMEGISFGIRIGEEGLILSGRIFQIAKQDPSLTNEKIAAQVGCEIQEVESTREMFGI